MFDKLVSKTQLVLDEQYTWNSGFDNGLTHSVKLNGMNFVE